MDEVFEMEVYLLCAELLVMLYAKHKSETTQEGKELLADFIDALHLYLREFIQYHEDLKSGAINPS